MNNLSDALAKQLGVYRDAYNEGSPIISDSDYDALEDRLRKLSPNHTFFSTVGGEKASLFPQATSGEAMLSLDKEKDSAGLQKFIGGNDITAAHKLDGGSLELRYTNGHLVETVSRGRDGELGFINTQNGFRVLDIPHFIKDFEGEIRGEVLQSKEDFEAFCAAELKAGNEKPKHPRNVAAAAMRQQDPAEIAKRKIRFRAYRIMGQIDRFPTETSVLEFLVAAGFKTPKYKYYKLAQLFTARIDEQLANWKKSIEDDEFACDGMVITFNDRAKQEKLGNSSNYPRWAKAFKWANDRVVTKVIKNNWVTGRTGRVSPTTEVEPVEVPGATISNCTAHNVGYVRKHKITVGAEISITRSGDIIPKHCETLLPTNKWDIPTHCPTCNSVLIEETSDSDPEKADLYCINIKCSAQASEKVLYYIRTVNIEHIGETILNELWNSKIITSIASLYLLSVKDLADFVMSSGKTLGRTTANKIVTSIETNKLVDKDVFLTALGLPGIGKGTSERLFEKFSSIAEIEAATTAQLLTVRDCGPKTVEAIQQGLKNNKKVIDEILQYVKLKEKATLVVTNKLNGKKFVITGTLTNPRDQFEMLIKAAGGILSSSVSRSTSYLVVGAEPGEGKTSAAKQHSVPTITEDELLAMLQ